MLESGQSVPKRRVHLTAEQREERDLEIHRLALAGNTLESIGTSVGLTRERVRQIIEERWPSLAPERETRVKKRRTASRIAEQERATEARVLSISEVLAARSEPMTLDDLVEHLQNSRHVGATAAYFGISEADVDDVYVYRGCDFQVVSDSGRQASRFAKVDLLACMRRCAQELELTGLSMGQYEAFINGRPDRELWPGGQTISNRFGSWRSACAEAGLEVGRPARPGGYVRQFDEADCRSYVDAYVREAIEKSVRPTFAGLDAWSRSTDGPSAPTIRNRLGLWSEVLASSLARLGLEDRR